jgi:hypothetical protein
MSRSKRIPLIKDKSRNYKRTSFYWRRIRRTTKTKLKTDTNYDDLILPLPREIVNDYDYCGYIFHVTIMI